MNRCSRLLLFGRLIYIANLWNPQTSRYDRGLPDRFRSADADKALTNWHRTFFTNWLSLSMTEKQKDVALYWKSIGASRDRLNQIREQGQAAIPPLVRAEERQFFLADLTLIQATL